MAAVTKLQVLPTLSHNSHTYGFFCLPRELHEIVYDHIWIGTMIWQRYGMQSYIVSYRSSLWESALELNNPSTAQ